jgi:hypothetical protein
MVAKDGLMAGSIAQADTCSSMMSRYVWLVSNSYHFSLLPRHRLAPGLDLCTMTVSIMPCCAVLAKSCTIMLYPQQAVAHCTSIC